MPKQKQYPIPKSFLILETETYGFHSVALKGLHHTTVRNMKMGGYRQINMSTLEKSHPNHANHYKEWPLATWAVDHHSDSEEENK